MACWMPRPITGVGRKCPRGADMVSFGNGGCANATNKKFPAVMAGRGLNGQAAHAIGPPVVCRPRVCLGIVTHNFLASHSHAFGVEPTTLRRFPTDAPGTLAGASPIACLRSFYRRRIAMCSWKRCARLTLMGAFACGALGLLAAFGHECSRPGGRR